MKRFSLLATCLPATAVVFHAPASSEVADGFDLLLGRVPSAVDVSQGRLPVCASTTQGACIETVNTTQEFTYTQTVASSSSRRSLVSSTTNAEGGGWGVHVSASVSYMKTSAMSASSVDLVCGAAVHTHTVRINKPSLMQLTNTSKALLQQSPITFLSTYGPHYIDSIVCSVGVVATSV